MNVSSVNRGRASLSATAALLAVALIALPVAAFAKTATRIQTTASTTVVRDTPGVNPWPSTTLRATLQKKISGTHYHGFSGTVKLYKWNLDTEVYDYTGLSRKSSSSGAVTFPIGTLAAAGIRGKYRLSYAGSLTMKPATSYSTFKENIGLTVSIPDQTGDITFERIGLTTNFWVNAKYTVGWNQEAWDGAVSLGLQAFFKDADDYEGDWVFYERDFMAPGTVEFNYKVDQTNVTDFPYLDTSAFAYVDDVWSPYIVETPEVKYIKDVTPVYN